MAKAKFDIKTLELPPVAAKPLYAGVGVTDLAVETVRDYVADVQKKISGYQRTVTTMDLQPKALRDQTLTAVNARVEALSQDAKTRRAAIEARVAELQADALAIPTTVTDTYADLAKRGEALVTRVRKQESTQATKKAAKTTTAKAKTTTTQATKASRTTAKKTSTAVKKTATAAKKSAAPATSSAKATTTAAKKTATKAAEATTEAAAKVGD